MITGTGRSIKTIGGTRLRLRSAGEQNDGQEMFEAYITAQRVPGSNEVVKLSEPRRVGRILDGRATFVQPLDNAFWTQAASLTSAARFLGQLAEVGMI